MADILDSPDYWAKLWLGDDMARQLREMARGSAEMHMLMHNLGTCRSPHQASQQLAWAVLELVRANGRLQKMLTEAMHLNVRKRVFVKNADGSITPLDTALPNTEG